MNKQFTPPPSPSLLSDPGILPTLMTASVSTRGMVGACFSDIERQEMYLTTLAYYLHTFPKLNFVFAENSGWDLVKFKEILLNDRKYNISPDLLNKVEFISIDPAIFDISRGKGYNELILINSAIDDSKLIQEHKAFFKVTGRYPIYNLNYFVKQASKYISKGYSLYCDIKDHKLYDWLHTGWNGHSFDCRLFGCSTEFFKTEIYPDLEKCDDFKPHSLLEDVMFNIVKETQHKTKVRFKYEPHLGGLAGHSIDAISFSQSHDNLKSKCKRFVGNSIRIITPWFKF